MKNSALVIGSVAFDDVKTPFGERRNALGGSAVFFSMAASPVPNVRIVGVGGKDYAAEAIKMLCDHNYRVTN